MYSPALLERHNAHFHPVRIAIVEARVRLSGVNHAPVEAVEKVAQPSASGASLMYAGYPYDPYA